ncbi:MAG: molybdenum ABC transporter ATP-binding protein, partial [Aestuariivirgaceae bacterium]
MAQGLELDCRLKHGGFSCDLRETLPLDGITALFGPSGSGKTMTLRMIAGLEPAAEGRIAINGTTWLDSGAGERVSAHRRGAGFVFQDARLFRHLDVAGNLDYGAKRGFGSGAPQTREQVIDALDLGGLLARRVAGLSGGERQRVAIGRAVLARPKLLLMDEPLSALDLPRRAEIMSYIEALPALFGIPIIYVTHAIDEVARLARSLALISSGRLVACGPVQETLARLDLPPLTGRFEAGVVLQGQVDSHDEEFALTSLDVGGQHLVIPALDLAPGQTARLRVRARDVAISRARLQGISIRNVLKATIAEVVLEPDTAFAEVRLALGDQDLRARITRKAAADLRLKAGLPVFALVKSVTLDRRLLT